MTQAVVQPLVFPGRSLRGNGSYAGYVDYSKLARAKLDGMTTATLGKFLMVCALASDLYCPAYLSSPAPGKDSDLAKQAAHYKINAERILRELKEQAALKSAKANKPKLQTPAKTRTAKR